MAELVCIRARGGRYRSKGRVCPVWEGTCLHVGIVTDQVRSLRLLEGGSARFDPPLFLVRTFKEISDEAIEGS